MHRTKLVCLSLLLSIAAARADILPEPDHGPPTGSAAGLDFAIQSVEVKFPPGYTKTQQVAVLVGCTEGHPNCMLARSRGVIGMEVLAVDGESLRPDKGRVRQILDAFQNESHAPVTLELDARDSNSKPVKIGFAKR